MSIKMRAINHGSSTFANAKLRQALEAKEAEHLKLIGRGSHGKEASLSHGDTNDCDADDAVLLMDPEDGDDEMLHCGEDDGYCNNCKRSPGNGGDEDGYGDADDDDDDDDDSELMRELQRIKNERERDRLKVVSNCPSHARPAVLALSSPM